MKFTMEDIKRYMDDDGDVDLRGTGITALPDNLTVGGSLDLEGTGITALPDNLTVGGSLYLSGTGITALPDNLTVGGWLYLSGTGITNRKCRRLQDGEYKPGCYIFADGILTHIKRIRTMGTYTFYVGKIKGRHVISDGKQYAHCASFKDGVCDLEFKKAADRGADQYKSYTLDTVVSLEEAKTMYRVITGACKAGTAQFVDSVRDLKPEYTVREIIEKTKGHYRSDVFAKFFEEA